MSFVRFLNGLAAFLAGVLVLATMVSKPSSPSAKERQQEWQRSREATQSFERQREEKLRQRAEQERERELDAWRRRQTEQDRERELDAWRHLGNDWQRRDKPIKPEGSPFAAQ